MERLRGLPLDANWTYLDVGCGNGVATLHVADALGLSVVGIDVDPEQIRLATLRAGGRHDAVFHCADAAHLPFEDGHVDIVATNKATHHMPRWRDALGEMSRVLRPGGYFLYRDLTVPAGLARLIRPIPGRRAGVFTRADLDRVFARLGLQLDRRATRWSSYDAVLVK